MANDLTTNDRAPGVPGISRLARQQQAWTRETALELAGSDPVTTLTAARDDLLLAFVPVPHVDSVEYGQWRDALASRLDSIGALIAPTMSVEQSGAWRSSMTLALADLPAMVTLTATKLVIHTPMTFLNEVPGAIRDIAGKIVTGRRDAVSRIERLLAALAAEAEPALPAPAEEPAPTLDEVLTIMRRVKDPGLRGVLRQAALAAGWIEPEPAAPSELLEAA